MDAERLYAILKYTKACPKIRYNNREYYIVAQWKEIFDTSISFLLTDILTGEQIKVKLFENRQIPFELSDIFSEYVKGYNEGVIQIPYSSYLEYKVCNCKG